MSRLQLPPILRVIRPHQWIKNALVMAPLLLAHVLPWQSAEAREKWGQAGAAFIAFCLTASAVYVLNDLKDVAADRAHPTKRNRPFASGALSTSVGPLLVLLLVAGAAAICLLTPRKFAYTLIVYAVASSAYTFGLKRRLLVDVFLLAGLYTLRLIAGGYAAPVEVSKWLMAFSIFIFVSLAFAKRYVELSGMEERGQEQAAGRNYTTGDLRIIESTGPAAGYMAVLVLALYINDTSGAAQKLYPSAIFLWMLCPLMMYWITRVWFVARRGGLDDDPILFAIRDRVSWYTLILAASLVMLASHQWGKSA